MKRSQIKILTDKAKVLKFMRKSKGISQEAAAAYCGVTDGSVGHYEHGRMDVSVERLDQLLECYGYSREEFVRLCKQPEKLPMLNVRDECIELLHHIDDSKLFGLYTMLKNFI
jgi:transcriptional regulator with XRE-family HTH domain